MSEDGSTTAPALVVDTPNFLSSALDLKTLLKAVKSHTKPAVEALVSLLGNDDPKIRLTAATKLLELQVELAKEINSDQLQRLIAEVKLNGTGPKRLVEDPTGPLVDFHTIREVE